MVCHVFPQADQYHICFICRCRRDCCLQFSIPPFPVSATAHARVCSTYRDAPHFGLGFDYVSRRLSNVSTCLALPHPQCAAGSPNADWYRKRLGHERLSLVRFGCCFTRRMVWVLVHIYCSDVSNRGLVMKASDRKMPSNKSLQATRDGRSTSASRFTSFGPACLSSGR